MERGDAYVALAFHVESTVKYALAPEGRATTIASITRVEAVHGAGKCKLLQGRGINRAAWCDRDSLDWGFPCS